MEILPDVGIVQLFLSATLSGRTTTLLTAAQYLFSSRKSDVCFFLCSRVKLQCFGKKNGEVKRVKKNEIF